MARAEDIEYVEAVVDVIGRTSSAEVFSYTGRGESRQPCLGIVCSDPCRFLYELGHAVGGLHDGAMANDLADFEIDSLGKRKVVYWPDIKYT